MKVDCLKCMNSGCCKLAISISKKEYEDLNKEVKKEFVKEIDEFFKESPEFIGILEERLEEQFKDNYAYMKRSEDGYCTLLDRETMLCSVYEDRPKTCKEYKSNKCSKIRTMSYEV